MIIKPKVRGFICINAHPQGCAANVHEQIAFTRAQSPVTSGPKNVLVLGCSTGYGLSSRIAAAFGSGASTLGVCFEKPPTDTKTASAGYYNTSGFHEAAAEAGLFAHTINGDAFSAACKEQVMEIAKSSMGKIDLVVYSLAAPRRTDPVTGEVYSSVLKPIGSAYTAKNLNTDTHKISPISVEPASPEEILEVIAELEQYRERLITESTETAKKAKMTKSALMAQLEPELQKIDSALAQLRTQIQN